LQAFRYIKREIPLYEVLGEEGLSLIEANCETVLAGSRHRFSR
jgi:trimethylamine:corrinoid methyltransferase-like protein